jgi:predicted Zn-dependent protease
MMKKASHWVIILWYLTGILAAIDSNTKYWQKDRVLKAMNQELQRSMNKLAAIPDVMPPYFMSYQVTAKEQVNIQSTLGTILVNSHTKRRLLDVDVRVGSYQLDNTHPLRGGFHPSGNILGAREISLEDDLPSLKAIIWQETDKKFKSAVERFTKIKTNRQVTVKEDDQSADFSQELPVQHLGKRARISIDRDKWGRILKEYSALFKGYPLIYSSQVNLMVVAETKYFTNSEGTILRHSRNHWRISMRASTKTIDGMDLFKFESFDAGEMDKLPSKSDIIKVIQEMIADLLALRQAPLMEPYTGPAILTGRAAGVFFHEIFGHRIEGHRQKDEREGQTFTRQLNKPILPDFISIVDDPTITSYGQTDLNGSYDFDDEGVRATRVEIVSKGILKNFLMSRSPIRGFKKSNGHGRKQPGRRPVSRMGNLLILAHRSVSDSKLRQMLMDECRRQKKSYGLFFKDISGGFTYTGRYMPQSFNVTPLVVYKIFTDGRPDQLVRGVDLIGTPLVTFSRIIGCSSSYEVFNGYCGAESGSVPVSAVAPAILTAQIEVQKKGKGVSKPPVLPPPGRRMK